ncbi:hypothetical protein [Salinispora sp. H7-4]|uniref:hypothetical protein n=1 Tax=Salinispora sp. H7-4 TaxID=2748321 RepID=UPI0015D1CAAF|nr:hypothetical protein [Salinispora sp. H7-4]NYT93440.1 hypothetical protein [Salinispora sp. H7-4]
MSTAPVLTTDLATAYRELSDLRAGVLDGDWAALRHVVDGQRPAARTEMISYAGDLPPTAALAQRQVEADPADGLAAALLGKCLIVKAWEVRTGYRAQYVSQDQFREFHRILRGAERMLIDAAAYQPGDPAVWYCRLLTARGLELGHSEARRRYDRLAESDPHHLPGQLQYLQQICPKWGGSYHEMHSFAWNAMLAAPEGAAQGSLVAQAHYEHLTDLAGTERADYRKDQRVREELREAAARSVLHPAFGTEHGWVEAVSRFALIYSVLGDHALAAPYFAAIGNLVSESVWGYFDDPVKSFDELRRKAMAKGDWR